MVISSLIPEESSSNWILRRRVNARQSSSDRPVDNRPDFSTEQLSKCA